MKSSTKVLILGASGMGHIMAHHLMANMADTEVVVLDDIGPRGVPEDDNIYVVDDLDQMLESEILRAPEPLEVPFIKEHDYHFKGPGRNHKKGRKKRF